MKKTQTVKALALLLILSNPVFATSSFILPKDNLTLDASLSVLNGKASEYVYEDGSKLSELNWKIRNVPIVKAGLTWDLYSRVTLNINGWTTLTSGDSGMDDYDWMIPGQKHWSDWSSSPATRLNDANQYDINLTGWVIKGEDYQLGPVIGYQETRLSWLATGGHYNYNNGTDIGDFPDGARLIGYKQKFMVPYFGVAGKLVYDKFDFVAQFKFSPWVEARDNDEHYMREISFQETISNSNYYSGVLNAGYSITPQTRIFTEVSWTRFSEGRGSTMVRSYAPEERNSKSGDAGIENHNYIVGAGIKHNF